MSAVKVAVRVRPFNGREIERGSKCVIQMKGRQTDLLNPKGSSGTDLKKFTFDYSYWSFEPKDRHFASQEKVFGDLGKIVLDSAFSGYNTCVFAYGQTGSGKTYSMMGWKDAQGIIPRIAGGLFGQAEKSQSDGQSFKAEVSYLEIYNERVRDLMDLTSKNGKHNLRVREHPTSGPYVENLSKHSVLELKDIMHLIEIGNKQRTTAATLMNDVSSRSHAIFTINFIYARVENGVPCETTSKINLVDLAGSERLESSGATGDRLREGSNINKSLTTLGLVISSLAQQSISASKPESEKKSTFVPYRDSVLTWLLKDSLGGNSKTVMLATVSPADINYGETLSTLRYAHRAKSIVNKPTVNEDPNVKVIRQLRAEIAQLKAILGNMDPGQLQSIQVKLDQSEALMANLTYQWEDKWDRAHKLMKERSLALTDGGGATVRLESEQPHLVEFSSARYCTSITICNLKEGVTTFGQKENDHDVVLTGPDILGLHCTIDYDGEDAVTLKPEPEALCFVNGESIFSPTKLSQGNIITLGKQSTFRFNHPAEAERLRHSMMENPDAEETSFPWSPASPFPVSSNKEPPIESNSLAPPKQEQKQDTGQNEEEQMDGVRSESDSQEVLMTHTEWERKDEELKALQAKLKEIELEGERSLLRELELVKKTEEKKVEALKEEIAFKDKLHQTVQEEKEKEEEERKRKEQEVLDLQSKITQLRETSALETRSQTLAIPKQTTSTEASISGSKSLSRLGARSPMLSNLKSYLQGKHDLEKCPQVQIGRDNVCSGFLIKQGEVIKNWKKRFFVFNPDKRTLTYFTDHTQRNTKGIIYFDGIQLVYSDTNVGKEQKDWSHTFHICTDLRTFHIRAQTNAALRIWMDLLSSAKITE